ncbi:hypothetical protein GRW76_23290 [Escherichia coli]|nr:hypothetical protein [Escherichia coli]
MNILFRIKNYSSPQKKQKHQVKQNNQPQNTNKTAQKAQKAQKKKITAEIRKNRSKNRNLYCF